MVGTERRQLARVRQSLKADLSSDCSLQLDYMKPELLVIAGQLNCGEYVLESCTHRPSSQGSWGCPKVCLAQDYGKFSDKD